MSKLLGTNISAPVVPNDSNDIFPSHLAIYGKGGLRTVANAAERNAIPVERRENLMQVSLSSDYKTYELSITNYNSLTEEEKLVQLANNSNWKLKKAGLEITEIINDTTASTGTTYSSTKIENNIVFKYNSVNNSIYSKWNTSGNTTGTNSVNLGYNSKVTGDYSTVVGEDNNASGYSSFAEGYNTKASGFAAHAEGNYTIASGLGSHTEGDSTLASHFMAHAEGRGTTASGEVSHSQNTNTTASGYASHAGGTGLPAKRVIASGRASFAHTEVTVNEAGNGEAAAANSALLAGKDNRVLSGATGSAVIGGSGITATTANTVYVPNLVVVGTIQDSTGNPITSTATDLILTSPDGSKFRLHVEDSGRLATEKLS